LIRYSARPVPINAWLPKRVPIEALREAYDLARFGPPAPIPVPARFVFLETEAAKARLLPALAPLKRGKNKSSASHGDCRLGR